MSKRHKILRVALIYLGDLLVAKREFDACTTKGQNFTIIFIYLSLHV